MNNSLATVVYDVCGVFWDPVPQEFKLFAEHLYQSSKQRISLRQNEEIARFHLCVMLTALNFKKKYNLESINLQSAPIKKNIAHKLLVLFQRSLNLNHIELPIKSPSSSPKKSPGPKTPRKRKNDSSAPNTPSPLKKLSFGVGIDTPSKSQLTKKLEGVLNDEQQKHWGSSVPASFMDSQPSTPKKKQTPNSASSTPISKLTGKSISSNDIITLCNKFQIEQSVTENILETFKQYYAKISNEWMLICGLILNCYFIINHEPLKKNLGSKSQSIKQMFYLQNGGLLLEQINTSLSIVKDLIIHSKWIKELSKKYNYKDDNSQSSSVLHGMITPDVQYHSKAMVTKYNEWIQDVKFRLASKT